mmetsp:Transcript_38183/g.95805  ORF Transcript_38183/g.95805 Transcript_38183/m.95805 type:complete len:203 (-) Transcript_38183:857-1465(-)
MLSTTSTRARRALAAILRGQSLRLPPSWKIRRASFSSRCRHHWCSQLVCSPTDQSKQGSCCSLRQSNPSSLGRPVMVTFVRRQAPARLARSIVSRRTSSLRGRCRLGMSSLGSKNGIGCSQTSQAFRFHLLCLTCSRCTSSCMPPSRILVQSSSIRPSFLASLTGLCSLAHLLTCLFPSSSISSISCHIRTASRLRCILHLL